MQPDPALSASPRCRRTDGLSQVVDSSTRGPQSRSSLPAANQPASQPVQGCPVRHDARRPWTCRCGCHALPVWRIAIGYGCRRGHASSVRAKGNDPSVSMRAHTRVAVESSVSLSLPCFTVFYRVVMDYSVEFAVDPREWMAACFAHDTQYVTKQPRIALHQDMTTTCSFPAPTARYGSTNPTGDGRLPFQGSPVLVPPQRTQPDAVRWVPGSPVATQTSTSLPSDGHPVFFAFS
jgi:hypothetical protein